MLIANPIYDSVFKRMMENERAAKFFIGTLLDEEIVNIEIKPQEFTFLKSLDPDNEEDRKWAMQKLRERLIINVMRLDYIATIKTKTGEYKKVLIEIQKAKNQIDLMRFRRYLGEQYKKEDKVNNETLTLPITTIYILGFTLPEIESACIKVERNYRDLVNKTIIEKKSDFVEKLTHDSYIVQVDRITDRYQTRLDKLLSIFEQNHFIDEQKIIKDFLHSPDNEDVKIITDILYHSAANSKERKKIEDEQEAWRTLNAMNEDKEKNFQKTLKALNESKKIIKEKAKENAKLLKQLEELKRKLRE